MRLFVAMSDGNLQIISYDFKGKLRVLITLSTPDMGSIRCITSDNVKNYLFACGYESGNIYIFDIGKPGQ